MQACAMQAQTLLQRLLKVTHPLACSFQFVPGGVPGMCASQWLLRTVPPHAPQPVQVTVRGAAVEADTLGRQREILQSKLAEAAKMAKVCCSA